MEGMFMWVLLMAALVEGAVLLAWVQREKKKAWECGRCHAQVAMIKAHLLRVLNATERYREGVAALDIRRADEASRDLARHSEAGHTLLALMAQRWAHPKRGTHYYLLDEGVRLNCSSPVRDGQVMVLYADRVTGQLSVRSVGEFHDGRFVLE